MRLPLACLTLATVMACGEPLAPGPLHPGRLVFELRPTDTQSNLPWRFGSGEVVESYASPDGGFRVHYTRQGTNQVPGADIEADGTPDFVQQVAAVYDEVGSHYRSTLGFRAPLGDEGYADNGGDGRFDVYLIDFALSSDGAFRVDQCPSASPDRCVGYVVQENDFSGYGYSSAVEATRILGSHEYFHAVQDAYDDNQGVVLSEGTAVWATEQFDPTTSDFEGFIGSFLQRPDRSLDAAPPGPVPGYAYGSALFFQFLTERYGPSVVRELWEHCENGKGSAKEPADVADPKWMVQLDALLSSGYQASLAKALREFATWNLYLGRAADSARSYQHGADYPQQTVTSVAAPYQQLPMRVFYASSQLFKLTAGGRPTMTAALLDDPATALDDTQGMTLLLAVRRAGKNDTVLEKQSLSSDTETVDTSGAAELLVSVVNTAREGSGGVLSKRPGLCIGSPQEVASCKSGSVPAPDAGTVDAGTPEQTLPVQGPALGPEAPGGCGCTSFGPEAMAWGALLWGVLASRRRSRGSASSVLGGSRDGPVAAARVGGCHSR